MKTSYTRFLSLFLSFGLIGVVNATPAGLINKWSAEGDATDSVGGQNGTTSNIQFAAGQVGQAFGFDGFSSINFGNSAGNFGTNDFTIALWARASSTERVPLISKRGPCNAGWDHMWSFLGSNEGIGFTFGESDANHLLVEASVPFSDGNFHHLAVTRRAGQIALYFDGILKSTASQVPNLPLINADNEVSVVSGTHPCIGWDGTVAFKGQLDEMEFYSRALSQSEVYTVAYPDTQLAIIQQPQKQHTLEGRAVSFRTVVAGIEPISYQWRLNGTDIPGAVSNVYTINNPQGSDAGNYSVFVSNPSGTLVSSEASLAVTNLATPTDSILARWSAEGNAVDGIGGHDGTMVNVGFVPGVLGTAFKFSGNSSVVADKYVANVGTNDFSVSFWIQTRSKGLMAVLGQRDMCWWGHMWDVRAIDTTAQPHAIGVEMGDDNSNWAGASTGNFNEVQFNDGIFHHVAFVRENRKISFYIDGRWSQSSYSRVPVTINNSARFTMGLDVCDFVDTTRPFVGALDEIEIYGKALSDAEVYSLYQPDPHLTVIVQPHSHSVVESNATSLSVTVTGIQPISYQWRLNGTNIAGATSSELSFGSATLAESGIYDVVATNPSGDVTSHQAALTVIPAASVLPGLIHKWSGEGNGDDLVGNTQVAGLNCGFRAGVSGQGFSFTNLYTDVNTVQFVQFDEGTGMFGSNDFTIDFWIYSDAPGYQVIMQKVPSFDFWLYEGIVNFGIRDSWGRKGRIDTGALSIRDNKFHHIAVTRGGEAVSMYVDGSLVSSTNIASLGYLDSVRAFALADDGSRPRFQGILDEVEMYNRSLTPTEIAGIYTKSAYSPRGTSIQQSSLAYIGGTVTFSNVVATGPGPLSYQWQLNGINIEGATDAILTVSNITANSSGVYTLVISNEYGAATAPAGTISLLPSPGTYNGLFYVENEPDDESSGFITLSLTAKQSFSGSIRQFGQSFSFSGKFSGGRSVVVNIQRPYPTVVGQPKRYRTPLTLSLTTSAVQNFSQVTGVVREGSRNIPFATQRAIYGDKNPTPQRGKYTLGLKGINSATAPNGNGFGNVTIATNGMISFVANLADDTTVSQGISVANSGVWPLYIPLYKGKGSLLGWLSFTNTTEARCEGNLRWIKSRDAGGLYYTNGFSTMIPVMGSTFQPQATGLGISVTNKSLTFLGGKIYSPLSDRIVSTNKNVITFRDGTTNRNLSVATGSGQFTGTFIHPVTKQLTKMKGIVLQNQGYGAGYFIGTNLSGQVLLK